MTVRLATPADFPAIRALYARSPYARTQAELPDTELTRPNGRVVVNELSGVVRACAIAFRDDTPTHVEDRRIFYQMFFPLLFAPTCLKDIAVWGLSLGYKDWYASVPQDPLFALALAYLTAPTVRLPAGRWQYLHLDDGSGVRLLGGTLDSVLAVA